MNIYLQILSYVAVGVFCFGAGAASASSVWKYRYALLHSTWKQQFLVSVSNSLIDIMNGKQEIRVVTPDQPLADDEVDEGKKDKLN